MRRSRFTTVVASGVVSLSLAACGGAESDPQSAIEEYMQAFADSDGDKICAMTVDENEEPLAGDELDDCAETWNELFADASDDEITDARDNVEKLLDEGPTKVEEDGDNATVTYEVDGETDEIELVKIDGKWYVSVA